VHSGQRKQRLSELRVRLCEGLPAVWRNILRIENNRPVLAVTDKEEIKRLDNECISCEYHCDRSGPGCIKIDISLD